MNRFVVVVDDSGSLRPEVVAFLDRPDIEALPFLPERHVRWSDPSGTVQYAGWERGTDIGADIDADGLVAWAGMPRPRRGAWPSGRPIVDLVRAAIDDPGWLPGVSFCDAHAVVRLRPDGTGIVASDPFGLHPLYRAETGGLTVVGNRPDVVAEVLARATGRPTARDLTGGAWMAFLGYHLTDMTGFTGVQTIPHDTHLEICRGRARAMTSPAVFDIDPDGGVPDLGAVTGRLVDAIADALRHAIARSPDPPHVELTGGKDSRVILAVALREGLTDGLRFVTYGAPELPDMQVARAIAERFGLDHLDVTDQHYRGAAAFTTIERYRRHVHRTCGASPCTDANEPVVRSEWVVSAHVGELYRTAGAGLVDKPPVNWEAATARVLGTRQPGKTGLVRTEYAAPMLEMLTVFIADAAECLHRPIDLLHAFNVRCRYPRWQGPLIDHHERRVLALCSPDAVRAAFAVGKASDAEALHHGIIHDASPDLAAVPFAKDSWRGAGMVVSESVRGAESARQVRRAETDHQEVLRSLLAERQGNPAFEVLDQDAIAAGIDGLVDLSAVQRMQLSGAVTALIWHGRTTSPSREV